MLTRVAAVSDTSQADAEYVERLHAAVSAALDFGIDTIESGEERAPAVPIVLLGQARVAARRGIGIDIVVRRYVAGSAVLRDFIMKELKRGDSLDPSAIQHLIRAQDALFDRLLALVVSEYLLEQTARVSATEQRRLERIRQLLDGELIDLSDLGYDIEGSHIGLIASGAGARTVVRGLAKALDRQLLLVSPDHVTVWAWLGGRDSLVSADLTKAISLNWPDHICLAIGEPAHGVDGWRHTHGQAKAAVPICLRNPGTPIRYADAIMLATVLQDEIHVRSLHELFLGPLEAERDGGETYMHTLRAYFAAEQNISSAAAALQVSRPTVASRLHAIERHLNKPIRDYATEIRIALQLHAMDTDCRRHVR